MTPDNLRRAAALLLDARRTRRWLRALPEECRPADIAEAYAIQRLVFAELGRAAAAWKVGAGSPDVAPACAAIAESTLYGDGAVLSSSPQPHRRRSGNRLSSRPGFAGSAGTLFARRSEIRPRVVGPDHRGVGYAFLRPGVAGSAESCRRSTEPRRPRGRRRLGGLGADPTSASKGHHERERRGPRRHDRGKSGRRSDAAAAVARQRGRALCRRPACRLCRDYRLAD